MKRLLLFAVVATLFAACTQEIVVDVTNPTIADNTPETLVVGFEGDDTRIQLNEAQKTVWTEGDLVSVFYRSNANQQWKYDGETGARTANLKRVDAGTATRDMDRVVVVYPYNEDYYINPSTFNVQASLPATQHYLANSYGLDGNIMISSAEYNDVTLKNVCGWLKLQLTGNGEQIKSITLRGNNGEQVAGELYINSADATAILASDMGDVTEDEGENATGGAGGNLVFEDTVLTEVTLNCLDGTSTTEKGVEVANTATAFYIALPPQTFTKGITVEITATNGLVMTKSTDNEVVIERNHIQPMKAFAADLPVPETWKIYYTATAKVEPYDKTVFGATYVSNEWDSETGEGVITFDGDVTTIGEFAFNSCESLASVTIPDSVTTIGEGAFWGCDSLTSVTIGNSVTTIGDLAFCECKSLTSVTIPDSVTSIGNGVFFDCTSLTSVTIGNSVTTIGEYAFNNCTSLTSVTIPDSVTTIGNGAFRNCDSLKEFKGKFAADNGRCLIMDNTIIAYANASGTTYTIPDSVTTIGDYAFYDCDSLTSVTIPDSVTTIGDYAFYDCTSLTSVTIGNSVTTIGDGVFFNCTSLTSVTIGNSVTTIGDYAFCQCYSLTSVTIPNSVTTIGDCSFKDCTSLTSVTIPDSVTTIGNYAFNSCTRLTSVTIGNSVTTIGHYAFTYCTSLKTVYCKPTVPPTGGKNMFYGNASGRKIYVPASDNDSIINAYKAKQYWIDYADYIFEEE